MVHKTEEASFRGQGAGTVLDDDDVQDKLDKPVKQGVVFTMGAGDMALEHLSRRIEARQIDVLVDVRTPPFSIQRLKVMPKPLSEHLAARDIRYLNLSEDLGDRPNDVSIRTQGCVDYIKYCSRKRTQDALLRLVHAHTQGLRVVVLDREDDPIYAHRVRCVGSWLHAHGIEPVHLTRHDTIMSHDDVCAILRRMHAPMHLSSLPERTS